MPVSPSAYAIHGTALLEAIQEGGPPGPAQGHDRGRHPGGPAVAGGTGSEVMQYIAGPRGWRHGHGAIAFLVRDSCGLPAASSPDGEAGFSPTLKEGVL